MKVIIFATLFATLFAGASFAFPQPSGSDSSSTLDSLLG